jgi:hypothetical protein
LRLPASAWWVMHWCVAVRRIGFFINLQLQRDYWSKGKLHSFSIGLDADAPML